MLVSLLRAAAVVALCLAVAVAQPTDAKLHPSSLRRMAGQKPLKDLQDAGFVVMPRHNVALSWNSSTHVISTSVSGSPVALVNDLKTAGLGAVMLGWVGGECGSASETWSYNIPSQQVRDGNMAALKKAGIRFAISTGGNGGTFTCASKAGFDEFLAGWVEAGLTGVDFDVRGDDTVENLSILATRVSEALSTYPTLSFSFTIPTLAASLPGSHFATPFPSPEQTPDPFSTSSNLYEGQKVMAAISRVFGFERGQSKPWPSSRVRLNLDVADEESPDEAYCVLAGSEGTEAAAARAVCQMGQTAMQAAYNVNTYYGVPMSSIELQPIIGDNYLYGDVFTAADAQSVLAWAQQHGLPTVHYDSYDRDKPCPTASPAMDLPQDCNSAPGVKPYTYAHVFAQAQQKVAPQEA